jgi:metal-responsive CopG/Arc/MetJ family transcriptional regulator
MRVVYVRMPIELIQLLDLDSRTRGLKRSELVRKIIQDYYENKNIFAAQLKQALGLMPLARNAKRGGK